MPGQSDDRGHPEDMVSVAGFFESPIMLVERAQASSKLQGERGGQ